MEGINFFNSKKEHSKGPNNFIDLWKQFHIGRIKGNRKDYANWYSFVEHTEKTDGTETLDIDETKYPKLPDSILEFCLHCRKAILRQFMAAVRRRCYCYTHHYVCH
jgi:hypothetical protein